MTNNGSFNRKRKERVRLEIMIRDGWECWICNKELMPFHHYLHASQQQTHNPTTPIPANYPTIDHLIERRNGGSNKLINLKLACPQCNNHRSNPPNPQPTN